MGRGRIEIRKIEDANSRQVTFSKRRGGLLKKAHELGVLCDAQVAVIIFSNTGKLFEYANNSMHQILARYSKGLETSKIVTVTDEKKPEELKEDILKKEIERLEMKHSQLLGKNLTSLGVEELKDLEHQLNESLLSVKERKEQILVEQLEFSRIQEQRALEENQTLRAQIAELKPLLSSLDCPTRVHVDYHPAEIKDMSANESADGRLRYEVEHEDTNLRLGFSSLTCEKQKPTEAAEHIVGAQKRKRRSH